jgi:hypothetical protein
MMAHPGPRGQVRGVGVKWFAAVGGSTADWSCLLSAEYGMFPYVVFAICPFAGEMSTRCLVPVRVVRPPLACSGHVSLAVHGAWPSTWTPYAAVCNL